MSTPILEPLPGLVSDYKRSATWEGLLVQTSASQLEARMQQQSFDRYSWDLEFNYLGLQQRGTYTDAIAAKNYQYLMGFYAQQGGGLLSFFYRDQEDNNTGSGSSNAAFIATGDGSTLAFQLQRPFGNNFQPVYGIDTRPAITYGPYLQPAALTPQAYVAGSPVSASFATETGIMTLASASGTAGQPISAVFSYLWRVRFVENSLEFDRMWNAYYSLKSFKIIQVLAP